MVEELLAKINDPEKERYLEQLKLALQQMNETSSQIKQYKSRKKQRLEEIETLRKTMEMSIEDQNRLKRTNRRLESKVKEIQRAEISDRVVTTEEIQKVEKEYRKLVTETLAMFDEFDFSERIRS